MGRHSQTLLRLWLWILRQGGSARPGTPRAGLSSLRPDLMAVALVAPVAHALVPRRLAAVIIMEIVVSGLDGLVHFGHRGVLPCLRRIPSVDAPCTTRQNLVSL
jgi:hypothetical protein